MAIQKNFMDDEDEQGAQGGNLEAAVAGGGAAPTASAQPQAAKQGTGWTNLQSYLTANQGQGAGVANKITEGAQKQVDTADQNAKLWEDAAKGRADGATRKNEFGEQIKSGDVSKIDQGAYSAWKNLGNYMGKKSAAEDEGYGAAYGQTQQAKQQVAGMQNYDNQKALANKTFNTDGRYTQGMGTLDTFIMRGDPTGQQALQSFQDKNKNVGAGFDTANKNVNSYFQGAESRGKANYDATMGAIKDRSAGIQATGSTKAQANYKAAQDKAMSDVLGAYDKAGVKADPRLLSNTVSGANDISYLDGVDDAEIAALNSLSGMDDDTGTNSQNRMQRDLSTIDWDLVNKNIAQEQLVGKQVDSTPISENGVVFTPTGERFDENGNRIDDVDSQENWNRKHGGFGGV